MHGHHAACGALPAAGPYLRLSRFRSGQASFAPIRKSGERFASVSLRASTRVSSAARSGIVHHLSGPDSMLTLEPFSEDQGRSAVHREDPANQLPYALRVYSPVDSHTCQTPWSVFQGGSNGSPQAAPEHADARRAVARAAEPRLRQRRLRGPLGGIYRPIGAAFPNNPTRRQRLRGATGSNAAGLSPSLAPLSRNLGPLSDEAVAIWRIEFTTACQGAPGILSSDFGQRRAVTRETSFRPISSRGLGAAICDTQAGVPSARRLEAQLAFKDFDGSRDSAIHTKYRISLEAAGGVYKGQGRSQRADDSRLLGIPR
ncbi:hypothetical protein Bca101_090340 [Brassica carinata]